MTKFHRCDLVCDFFGPGRRVQKATLVVVLLVVVISCLRVQNPSKAFLIRSGAQRNFAHIRADIPHRSTVSDFPLIF